MNDFPNQEVLWQSENLKKKKRPKIHKNQKKCKTKNVERYIEGKLWY